MLETHFLDIFERRSKLLYPSSDKSGILVIVNTLKASRKTILKYFSILTF